MTMSIHEAYNTLGLARDASPEQVKKAYRKLALQFHPDKNSDPAATAKFQQLSAAYKRVDDHLKRGASPGGGSFDDFFGGAPFDEFDDEDFDLDDGLGMPSMEEMLFMFDMLFGSSPPSAARRGAGKRKKGKKSGAVRVNLRKRKGGKRQMPHEPPGFPSYVDQELMDMFARGMMFDGADAGLSDLEDEFVSMSSFLAQSGMGFDSEIPTWSEDDEQKAEETHVEMKEEGSFKQTFVAAPESNGDEAAASSSEPAIGSKVLIHGKHPGVVKFKGSVHYAKGEFVGIDLSSPVGKNDGSVKGVRYFECSPSHGLMVRPNDVTLAA